MVRSVSVAWSSLFGSLFIIFTAVGLFGNIFVIIAISGDAKMRKTVMNMLLLNLAIADALNLVTSIVEWLPTVIFGHTGWILPEATCPVARCLEVTFLFVSITTQLIVCVERFIAIVYPIHARRLCSRRNVLITILLVWLFVTLFTMPYALLHEIKPQDSTCTNPYTNTTFWLRYKWTEFISFYFLPCIIFLILYTKVSRVLWAKNRLLYHETNSKIDNSSRVDYSLRMRRNVVKMLVACVSVYFICYSPIQAIFLSKALLNVNLSPPYGFILLMNALAIMCSACNPLLYTLFSKKFRTRLGALVMCTKQKDRAKSEFAYYSNSRITPNEVTLEKSAHENWRLNNDDLTARLNVPTSNLVTSPRHV
ncbi:hypothetical protein AB6A40_005163 [Gnathostoma spinigerum]|uniref:G-protein coupled receptors family 1 profile domain-containing protein n=1 Tax=Gnathostoma spinigerum TaxID=75299 RepID=A0ABD6EMA6_9BILA